MRTARPVILRQKNWKPVEVLIQKIFYDIIFRPVLEVIDENGLQKVNSIDDVLKAIASGRLHYVDGYIKGSFNASLSKELKSLGGVYNQTRKGWKFEILPPDLQIAVADAKIKAQKTGEQIIEAISRKDIMEEIKSAGVIKKYDEITGELNKEFQETISKISVMPELTPDQKNIISKQWGENLELYIKDFTEENILELRQKVESNVISGGRADAIYDIIQKNYSTTNAKARFLAKQETSLLLSKMRETRYQQAGSQKYIWSGVMDERERPDHKALEGQVYSWDSPPVVDRKTGRRAHPGEDFGCRCIAKPVFE